jgi:glycerol kinase
VAESIVFLIQVNLEAIQRASGALCCIRVTGGLAQSDGLCQRLADVSGLLVERPSQCEATAQGLAYLLSGRESGWASHVLVKQFVPHTTAAFRQRYLDWREAMEREIKHYA